MSGEALLERFPKIRPALSPEIAAIYQRQYIENRNGDTRASSIAQKVEAWMHRKVAADLVTGGAGPTLELGAGSLNQLDFEPAAPDYDIVEPFSELFAGSAHRARIRDVFADIAQVPADRRYRRITSIAALEHICDLPPALARAALLLANDGALRVAIPSEGGFLWALGWKLTTGLEFRMRHGLDYGELMRHEHVNTAVEIEDLLKALFAEVRIESFGVGRQFSLYRFIVARRPRLEVAQAWLARYA